MSGSDCGSTPVMTAPRPARTAANGGAAPSASVVLPVTVVPGARSAGTLAASWLSCAVIVGTNASSRDDCKKTLPMPGSSVFMASDRP